MRLNLLGYVTAVGLLAGISNASADVVTVTWTGTVYDTSATDTNGYFGGGNIAGDAFTATLVYDTATPGSVLSLGSANQVLSGGTVYASQPVNGLVSPVQSASLTINGQTLSWTGVYLGSP
jgi:hypothetical protein